MLLIRELIATHPFMSRAELSRKVCEQLDWRGADGRLRAMRCRVVMLRMHEVGIIQLPEARHSKAELKKERWDKDILIEPTSEITTPVHEFKNLSVEIVSSVDQPLSRQWNANISKYHYLGYQCTVGHQIRYIVKDGTTELAFLGFASAALKVASRDKYIGWTNEIKTKNLNLVVNNTRFLILPWVKSPNLASWILSHIAKRLPKDWTIAHGIRPVMLETFVDATRYTGHCYRAANWKLIGITEGRGRYDRYNKKSEPKKQVWLMPISKKATQILCV
jgi:hypothetical protein